MAFTTFQVLLEYDIKHGAESPIIWGAVTHPLPATTSSPDILFDISVGIPNDALHYASAITTALYRARSTYVDDAGNSRPLDKWGTYGIDAHAIPEPDPPLWIAPGDYQELRRGSEPFDLDAWRDKYWTGVPGGHYQEVAGVNPDRTVLSEWPDGLYRHAHSIQYGMGYRPHDSPYHPWPPSLFRLAARIEGPAEKYLLYVTVYRGQRTTKRAIVLEVSGTPTNEGLLKADYLPVAIVYSPPGQDMSNSLLETARHGTRFTFTASDITAETWNRSETVRNAFGANVIGSAGVKVSTTYGSGGSQSATDQSASFINVEKSAETMITANNRTAIGRAFWGPLGDVFVVIKDLLFYGYEFFDADTGWALVPLPDSPNARKLLIPTRELLRPDEGSAADGIPWDTRKRILHLNPFVVDDDTILDEVEQGVRPLEDAVDPDLDPNRDNPARAIKVLSLDLGRGTEIDFYESRGVSVGHAESRATSYVTTLSHADNIDMNWGMSAGFLSIGQGFGVGFSTAETIEYQTTSELFETDQLILTAKCYLVRNQNEPNPGPLDVYYDTIFGTFMFRRPAASRYSIAGVVRDIFDLGVIGTEVKLIGRAGNTLARTGTDSQGVFRLSVELASHSGETLVVQAGEATHEFRVDEACLLRDTTTVNFEGVVGELDLERASYQDLMDLFGIDSERVNRLSRDLRRCESQDDVLRSLDFTEEEIDRFKKRYSLKWDRERLARLSIAGARPRSKPKNGS